MLNTVQLVSKGFDHFTIKAFTLRAYRTVLYLATLPSVCVLNPFRTVFGPLAYGHRNCIVIVPLRISTMIHFESATVAVRLRFGYIPVTVTIHVHGSMTVRLWLRYGKSIMLLFQVSLQILWNRCLTPALVPRRWNSTRNWMKFV